MATAMIEPLEDRLLMARSLPDASSVTLTRADGSSAPVLTTRDTWIIVHGLLSSKDALGIEILTAAVDGASKRDQVLLADWRKLAIVTDKGGVQERAAQATANALADQIAAMDLPASRVNLIGFSMGGLVVGKLADALARRGGVNTIIGLDPSSPRIIVDGKKVRAPLDLARNSKYSIVFHGVDIGSPIERALTADDTIRINNIGTLGTDRHAGVFDVFVNMTKINNSGKPDDVSKLFSLGRIIRGDMPDWRKDFYNPIEGVGGYEAVIRAQGTPGTMRPKEIFYAGDADGKTRKIRA
jgi:pimeloyl-ACP methyl ester carboxylesterase